MPIPSRPAPDARNTLRKRVEGDIRAAIFDGTLVPGEILHTAQLQEWLGVSRQPIREALNDLARVGLVELVPQRYTRVAIADPNERTAVLQTLGALFGGVVRVTVPALTAEQKATILAHLDRLVPLVAAQDAERHGTLGWELIDLFIDYCPNRILVRAAQGTIDSLTFQLSSTRTEENSDWESLAVGYPALREAIVADEAIAAEQAIERVFRLTT